MKAIEFKSKIKNNQIMLPVGVQAELNKNKEKNIRVILLIEDTEKNDDLIFKESTMEQFLKGYADSDSIYDNL